MNIRIYPNPVLREKAKEIKEFDTEHLDYIIHIMEDIIKEYDAVGLAANQLGIMEQLVVTNVNAPLVLINPQIVSAREEETLEEGCLSFPGIELTITHHKFITVKGFNRYGELQTIEADGLLAKVLEHEIDHLNGVLIIDKLSPAERLDFEMQWKTGSPDRGDYEKKHSSRVL